MTQADMTYAERQLHRFRTRVARFLEFQAGGPRVVLAEEGALLIESVIAIAGHEAMGLYARNALMHAKSLNGLCPWEHGDGDDPSLHPIADCGMCVECLTETRSPPMSARNANIPPLAASATVVLTAAIACYATSLAVGVEPVLALVWAVSAGSGFGLAVAIRQYIRRGK